MSVWSTKSSIGESPVAHYLKTGVTIWGRSVTVHVAGIALIVVAAVLGFARWQTGSSALVWPWLQGQRLLFEPTRIVLGDVPAKTVIDRQIRVVNVSSRPLSLLGSQKSCGCISLDEFPIVVPPGGDHQLQLKIGTSDKLEPVQHVIKFFSDEPGYSSVIVTVVGFVR